MATIFGKSTQGQFQLIPYWISHRTHVRTKYDVIVIFKHFNRWRSRLFNLAYVFILSLSWKWPTESSGMFVKMTCFLLGSGSFSSPTTFSNSTQQLHYLFSRSLSRIWIITLFISQTFPLPSVVLTPILKIQEPPTIKINTSNNILNWIPLPIFQLVFGHVLCKAGIGSG